MITINLNAESSTQKRLKKYLEQNASETLADKINNGVYIEKDGKRLLNKKDLNGFIKFATEEARKQAAKGESGACVEDDTVFGWLIHYFEENDITGKLYNEDGSEYKSAPVKKTTTTTTTTTAKPAPKPQLSMFDLLSAENKTDEAEEADEDADDIDDDDIEEEPAPIIEQPKPEQKKGSPMYQNYLKLVEKHKGFLILYRLGDFYEAFADHATTLSNELDLTLTGRDVGLDERVPMTGIPYHAVNNYVNKLVDRGYKVALAEDFDTVIEVKPFDDYEEPEELSEEEMREFDSYVDEEDESEELLTISKIVGQVDDEDDTCNDILDEEAAKAFDKEAMCIISELLDGEITLA
ncbi:MAG: hypothetical protein J1E36_08445 [Eubacterium sp.]|nr:hypothetical protein [Eubacterium sp.]